MHTRTARLAAALALATGLASAAHADDAAALAAAAKEPGAVVTPSGLVFRSLKEGTGASPKATDKVKVNYKGSFVNGTKFDASDDHGGPISFPLNHVIPCWTEGVQKLKVGGKAKLTCPSAIAYGANGAGGVIPPDATLVFEVELLGIN
jgi:FKBP-type peptidyl-prolyl cis-trans isomerase FkpA